MSDGRWLAFVALAALAAAGQMQQGGGGSAARRRAPRKRRTKPVGRHALSWAPPKEKITVTPQGDVIRQIVPRPPRGRGTPVNPQLKMPKAPGPWVDLERCAVCGQTYRAFNSGVSFGQGVTRIRQTAGWQAGGGYRTPGPVLYAMRTIKAERWYMEHFMCGAQHAYHQQYRDDLARWREDHAIWRQQVANWRATHPLWADPQQPSWLYEHDPSPVEPRKPVPPQGPQQQHVPF